MSAEDVLSIQQLNISFVTPEEEVAAVRDFSLTVRRGECVGIIGESGAGKSQALLAVMGLLAANARVSGTARFGETELLGQPLSVLDTLRGSRMAMIFQDPMTSLTPHIPVGDQIAESLVKHQRLSWQDARARALELLESVHVTDAQRRLSQYPHELSGGMRQRVMIAIALACGPELLIADEPTTALDVTVQAQILSVLAELKDKHAMSLVLITHDLGVIASVADRVVVMQAGRVVEQGDVRDVLKAPRHPYTQALLAAVPRITTRVATPAMASVETAPAPISISAPSNNSALGSMRATGEGRPYAIADTTEPAQSSTSLSAASGVQTSAQSRGAALGASDLLPAPTLVDATADRVTAGPPLLAVDDVCVEFPVRRGWLKPDARLRAVDRVSFVVHAGEALGVVGESGCGKSTLARAILQLVRPASGQIVWMGDQSLSALPRSALRPLRKQMQIVFQDPLASLDPRMTIGEIVAEPLRVHRPEMGAPARRFAVEQMLARVGLSATMMARYPHEFSGGQCQRAGIARAMILDPKLLVCDEAVSALDVSIQAQIVALLSDLRREYGMAILFVSHNLAVVQQLCDRVMVLYLGRMMELAPTAALYDRPLHPYTRGLLAAVPIPDPDIQKPRLREVIGGELPSPLNPPSGCVFRTRCPHAIAICRDERPAWEPVEDGAHVACHRWKELSPESTLEPTS